MRNRAGLVLRVGGLDAARLAPAAGWDLRLDHPGAGRKLIGIDLVGIRDEYPRRHGNTMSRENLFGVVLEQDHGSPPAPRKRCIGFA